MTLYPITGSRRERLTAWLAFNGITLEQRKGRVFARVERKGRRSAIRLVLHDDGRSAAFVGNRACHRSIRLERLMRAWNQAEMYLPGTSHDLSRHLDLEGKADHEVQTMVDYYADHPVGLESIGVEEVRIDYDVRKRRTVEQRRTPIATLCDLVVAIGRRAAYVAEIEQRNITFLEVNTSTPFSLPVPPETAFSKCSFPTANPVQLDLFAEVA